MVRYQDPIIGEWFLKRTKTRSIRASFNKTGRLEIRAPKRLPVYQVKEFVAKHRAWVKKHQPPLHIYNYGDMVLNYTIVRDDSGSLGLDKKLKLIKVDPRLVIDKADTQAEIDKLAGKVVTDYGKPHLVRIAGDVADQHGFKPSRIGVRAMHSRWGSCSSKGRINLSSYLVFLEPELIEYVILHELTHLKHLNHSKQFWQALEKIWPDYKQTRKQLRQYRPQVMLNTTPKIV